MLFIYGSTLSDCVVKVLADLMLSSILCSKENETDSLRIAFTKCSLFLHWNFLHCGIPNQTFWCKSWEWRYCLLRSSFYYFFCLSCLINCSSLYLCLVCHQTWNSVTPTRVYDRYWRGILNFIARVYWYKWYLSVLIWELIII